LSGHDAKLDRPRERYLVTTFCYGCDLGATRTARSIQSLDHFKLAFVNQRHITEANLNDAITEVVNAYTVHADTQGQSEAIFGLMYLLGIELQPRIRDWKGLAFYRADRDSRYDHIDALFTAQANWDLVEGMLPDMLRVAVSIQSGAILPSDILRRLGSYSRKNKLYFAFRELGRVVRTIFLLRYVADAELRQVVHAATTKSERFKRFVQWVAFGGNSVIAENVRDEQRKFFKYNH
jgi:TnpA family transposase